jgi:hypothetical protein
MPDDACPEIPRAVLRLVLFAALIWDQGPAAGVTESTVALRPSARR